MGIKPGVTGVIFATFPFVVREKDYVLVLQLYRTHTHYSQILGFSYFLCFPTTDRPLTVQICIVFTGIIDQPHGLMAL